ncbi:LytS/YhcK type 5TM receptor domain-containing protein, partial [Staphylococcus epidermidis]|uniref:LytS/YhcK type 5TM receptor domain-containing protein n=1 Tax=Staphylococcus epidermidis TaxID=1282 RepID=UPI0028CB666C
CILLFRNNLDEGIRLVSFIGVGMIMINSLGRGIFLRMILWRMKEEEEMGGVERDDVLEVGKERVGYFGCGVNEK